MKIMICLGGLKKGGAERVVSNLANYLNENKHEVILLTTILDSIEYKINDNIIIESLKKSNSQNFILKNINRIKSMKQKIIDHNPDIILAFLQEPIARVLFLKAFSNKIRKIPTIISVRNDPKTLFKTIKSKISLLLYNNSDGYVFQTNEVKQFFNKKIQEKSKIISNPVDKTFFTKPYEGERENTIVSVGRLTEQKNYPLLIKAFKEFNKSFPEHKLLIYGEGNLKLELQNLVSSLTLNESVIFKGTTNDIKKEIYKSNMFVISSDYEGLSNALMESMALGLPCISTESSGGGASSLIKNNENGILVPINDIKSLTKAMIKIAKNKDFAKKISINANTSIKKHDPKIINKEWEEYIQFVYNRSCKNEKK